MKILHVITNLYTGGAEKLIVDLLPRLNSKDYNSEICLFNGTITPFFQKLCKAGIKIHIFDKKDNYYSFTHLYKLIKLAKKFDIIHTHNTSPQLFGAIASLFCNVKLITTEHTTMSHRRVWWFKTIERWMYGRYSHVICISADAQKNMYKVADIRHTASSIISNGIELNLFKNALPLDKTSINTYSNSKVLLMVGRYSYQKDQATIIRAMTFLPENVELWLAGYGDTHNQLLSLSNKLKVSHRVHFLGMRTDVHNLFKACDIVIQSSHIEGFGLAAVEGMAAGKPVIASNVQGLAQVVEGAGILFQHDNEQALATEITHLLEDINYYNYITNRCIKRAETYDIQKMIESYKKVYIKVLNI